MSTVHVASFLHAASHTFTHVVADAATGAAAIIDPVLDYDPSTGRQGTSPAEALLEHVAAHRLQVRWLLETHAHADHLSAAPWLKMRLPGARLGIGAGIVEVQKHFVPEFGFDGEVAVDGSQFDHLFTDGERLRLGDAEVRVIAVPGHTPDSIAYLIGDALFPGDSIFMPDGGTARCDFPGGNAHALYRSIRRLFQLPDATRVFVCHDYGPGGRALACETTIGAEKAGNIHVGGNVDEGDFVQQRTARDATLAPPALMVPSIRANIRGLQAPMP